MKKLLLLFVSVTMLSCSTETLPNDTQSSFTVPVFYRDHWVGYDPGEENLEATITENSITIKLSDTRTDIVNTCHTYSEEGSIFIVFLSSDLTEDITLQKQLTDYINVVYRKNGEIFQIRFKRD